MPTRSPRRLTSAPPELPGLMEASVWMKSSKPSGLMPERFRPLTIPEVTCAAARRGCRWPPRNRRPPSLAESPRRICARPSGIDLHHGDVGGRIAADDLGFEIAAVLQRHGDLGGVIHHVRVGDDVAVLGVDDHAGAGALERPLARTCVRAARRRSGGRRDHRAADSARRARARCRAWRCSPPPGTPCLIIGASEGTRVSPTVGGIAGGQRSRRAVRPGSGARARGAARHVTGDSSSEARCHGWQRRPGTKRTADISRRPVGRLHPEGEKCSSRWRYPRLPDANGLRRPATSMRRGCSCACLGMVTSSTPLMCLA